MLEISMFSYTLYVGCQLQGPSLLKRRKHNKKREIYRGTRGKGWDPRGGNFPKLLSQFFTTFSQLTKVTFSTFVQLWKVSKSYFLNFL